MKFSKALLLIFSAILFTSCISDVQLTNEKRFSMLFQVQNLGEPQEFDEGELIITELKFAIDRFQIAGENDLLLETGTQINAMIFSYNEEMSGNNLVLDVGLGISEDMVFNSYTMFLEPLQSRSNIFDDDFFGDDENYSLIIKGTIDESSFEFKSTESFEKLFDFSNVEVKGENETLVLRKRINAAEVLFDDEGEFIDPRIEENDSLIAQQVKELLTLTADAESIY